MSRLSPVSPVVPGAIREGGAQNASLAALVARLRAAPPLPPLAAAGEEGGPLARARKEEGLAAFLHRAAEEAARALAAPDPDLDHERAEVAAAQAAEARGVWNPLPEAALRAMLAGLLAAARLRPAPPPEAPQTPAEAGPAPAGPPTGETPTGFSGRQRANAGAAAARRTTYRQCPD